MVVVAWWLGVGSGGDDCVGGCGVYGGWWL